MKRLDYLLWLVAEEAVEVAQRASKAARFGLEEVQPGQEQNNALRMFGELADLLTAFDMLTEESAVMRQANLDAGKVVVETRKAKRAKIEKFMLYSIERGTLEKRYNARHERIGPGLGLEPEVLISQSALPR